MYNGCCCLTNQLIRETKSVEKTIRKKSDYVHFLFATANFLLMFITSLDFFTTLAIGIALAGISLMLYIIFFYYWKIRSQFYIVFNYGSTICSLIILFDFIFMNLFNLFFFIAPPFYLIYYFIYLLTLIKNFGGISISRKKFIAKYVFQGYGPKKVDQMWHDDSVDTFKPMAPRTTFEEEAKFKKERKKLFSVITITLLTLIFTSCFLIIYTYALMY